MTGFHETELCNRMRAAWACFSRHQGELTNKRYPIKSRLRLFEATVSATALYGCEAWTLKVEQQRRLRTTHRKMLRTILGAKRWVINSDGSSEALSGEEEQEDGDDIDLLEPWVDFLKRTTKRVEDLLAASELKDWLTTWRRRQWKWARQLMEPCGQKWSQIAFDWNPPLHGYQEGRRTRGRQCLRWKDCLLESCHVIPSAQR